MPICPRCLRPGDGDARCEHCGLVFRREGGVLDVLGADPREARAREVEDFYTRSPFPGYAPADDAGSLLDRSRRSGFLVALDEAIPPDARVLDLGCGTGQLAAFLALAAPRRTVFGIDGCRASLRCGDGFRSRVGATNLQFVRADLFENPAAEASFETVVCRGVVHHTPDPERAIECAARCVAPGGILLLGFYETIARLFHRMRRGLSRARGTPIAWLDPVLRRRDLDPEKKRIWIEDQYRHPLEHILPMPRVWKTLVGLGFSWVRSVPPLPRGSAALFEPTRTPGALGRTALRTSWMLAGPTDPDAGLVCLIARKTR